MSSVWKMPVNAPPAPHARWNLSPSWPTRATAVYDLSQPLAVGMPHHPNHPPFAFALTKRHGDVMYPDGVSASAELISMGGHAGTHIDALAHVSKDGRVHGGQPVADAQSYTEGMRVAPVDDLPPLLAPGRLVDAPTLLGRPLTPDDPIGAVELERWFSAHRPPAPGDVVLIRTGWDRLWGDVRRYLGTDTGNPGVTLAGARWLADRGVIATGADTIAYEKMPSPALDVHVHLLVECGIPIMEALDLSGLAADNALNFFFIAAPLRVKGGTGSPIRPLAFVTEELS